MIRNIAFFGFADTKPREVLYQSAYETAKILAQEGYTVVNGGGPGVMRASSEGAKAGKGRVIGVTFNPIGMVNFEGKDPSNQVDEEIMLANYVERTLKLLEMGDIYVIFAGGTGTISEFGMAWGLARLYFGYHKPLILYGSFWHEIIEVFARNMPLRQEELEVYRIVNSPQEALITIRELAAE